MLFGEIVEPSTRALIDEDDCHDYKDLEWVKNTEPGDKYKRLLISETQFANTLLKTCLIDQAEPLCRTLRDEIIVYRKKDDCIILCNILQNISLGETIENILPWVEKSEEVFTLTTAAQASYLNYNNRDAPLVLMRMLSTHNSTLVPTLETPNLITGVGAGILSYCAHTKRKCLLFVGYINCEPLDSLNSKPFVELLAKIDMEPVKNYVLREKLPANNLYM